MIELADDVRARLAHRPWFVRIVDDTLTVFSLYVTAEGGYEIQQFDRSLAKGGLDLEFSRLNSEDAKMAVSTHLKRQ